MFYITKDGYVDTNIFEFRYLYFIGEEAADKIITYAMSNVVEDVYEPYEYTLVGTLTEIGDEYILIDDTIICTNESEGMVFKVLTDDMRVRRSIESGNIKVGDLVVVSFTGLIDISDDNTVTGAYYMRTGILVDGGAAAAVAE